jgi:hypothetical protein
MMFASVVYGVQRNSGASVYGCEGGLCVTAYFSATYDVVLQHSEGQTYWHVSKIEIYGTLGYGSKNAADVWSVDPEALAWNVQFKNAAGTTLLQVYPTGSSCWPHFWDNTALYWVKCKSIGVDLPYSTTQVKINALIADNGANGAGWQKSWTMSLN